MPTNEQESTCLSQADLERYAAGEMTGAESERAHLHLESCSACRLQVELIAGDSDVLFDHVREAFPTKAAEDLDKTLDAADADSTTQSAGTIAPRAPAIEGYEIVRELHRGGQGVVYLAAQRSTKRKVAIKLLLDGAYASRSARKRFDREIELAANLKHPNIISIFHSGQTDDGHQYCVMDYVRGVALDQHVRDHKLTLEEALRLFSKVCAAVNYAHQKGVIHRDLKPSNILVDVDGTPKVLDFGLARQLISPEASLISVTGQVVGTLPYMSPEQARGNPDEIDTRTDIYALGVILYELLTGHYPYPVVGQMAEILRHITDTEPTPPSRQWKSDSGISERTSKKIRTGECPIDDEIQTIVLKTLSKERDRRYQSAGELARDVGHYLADEPIEAKRDSAWYILNKTLRRHQRKLVAGMCLLVVVAAIAIFYSVRLASEREARLTAQERALDERTKRLEDREQTLRFLGAIAADVSLSAQDQEAARILVADLMARMRIGDLSQTEIQDTARLLTIVETTGGAIVGPNEDSKLRVKLTLRRYFCPTDAAVIVSLDEVSIDEERLPGFGKNGLQLFGGGSVIWDALKSGINRPKGGYTLKGNVRLWFVDHSYSTDGGMKQIPILPGTEGGEEIRVLAECTLPIPSFHFLIADSADGGIVEVRDPDLVEKTKARVEIVSLRWEHSRTPDDERRWCLGMRFEEQFTNLAMEFELHDSRNKPLGRGVFIVSPEGRPLHGSLGLSIREVAGDTEKPLVEFYAGPSEEVEFDREGTPVFVGPVTVRMWSSQKAAILGIRENGSYMAFEMSKVISVSDE